MPKEPPPIEPDPETMGSQCRPSIPFEETRIQLCLLAAALAFFGIGLDMSMDGRWYYGMFPMGAAFVLFVVWLRS